MTERDLIPLETDVSCDNDSQPRVVFNYKKHKRLKEVHLVTEYRPILFTLFLYKNFIVFL